MNFKNTDIYKSYGDYVLGGCSMQELGNIHTPQSGDGINEEKIMTALTLRIQDAVEDYLEEATESLVENGDDTPTQTALVQLNDLLKSYLGIEINDATVRGISDTIRSSQQYTAWIGRIKQRIEEAKQSTKFNGFATKDSSEVGVSEEEVDSTIAQNSLAEILETLTSYA